MQAEPWATINRVSFTPERGGLRRIDGFGLFLVSLFRGRPSQPQPRTLEEHYRWLHSFLSRQS